MKTINLLGISQDSIAVIFDLLIETKKYNVIKIHSNIEEKIIPNLPVLKTNYQIASKTEAIDINQPVFFGCASPKNKYAVYNYFKAEQNIQKSNYTNIIHSSAYISPSSNVESGVLIEPNTVISSQTKIEFGVYIKRGSLIGHHNIIGAFTDINPGVTLSGKIIIGKYCVIGSGTVIKDNITIGDNSIIGIGSVVTKDIPANSIAFGNPCRVVKKSEPLV